ncbi:MAG: cytochrome b6-f complex iron-sulfur subunit [Algoriphagus sp.]|jgi:cytochrome b6-f complex iron-sulfur subunit
MEIKKGELEKKENIIERKDFMKQVGLGFGAVLLMNCLQACGEAEIPDPMPGTGGDKLDFTLNLTTGANMALQTNGGFIVSNKVIIARTLTGTFIAVDAACTHQQTTVSYIANSNDFLCPNHGSKFGADGKATKGPATVALKKYNTSFDATALTLRVFE